ncbi:hypothetical protein [Variovorax sp. GT1P44]|uniref:hypothetical protein n=1 Tax=Variovorax sp. GT1P44 TaxID=3443742 RepID=UPI003F471635
MKRPEESRHSRVIEISNLEVKKLVVNWAGIFKRANLYSQVFGVLASTFSSWITLGTYWRTQVGFWAIPRENLTVIGFAYLYCITLLYTLIITYVTRCVCIALFLRSLVANSILHLFPFHPDGCGGLQPIGRLGLRNQYSLSVLGVNVAILTAVTVEFLVPATALYSLVGVAIFAYVILGPTVFLGPLLPFRKGMEDIKIRLTSEVAKRLQQEFRAIRSGLGSKAPSKEDVEVLERLKRLTEIIRDLPVWPFDARTLRRFASVYVAPLALTLVTKAAAEFLPRLLQYFF